MRVVSDPEVRVGYVPGAWDMFHVGHLNILLAAKARCDVLIAGVVTDEVLFSAKGKWPVVPLAERLDVVAAMRPVDFAVVGFSSNKIDAWSKHGFDILFKGNDWQGTRKGEQLEQQMRAVGVELTYLPYTSHTSSTKLRSLITTSG
jgi:glycerol-3-phosphate cytidylyltransferase